ncbi:MAG: hypothetical protein RL208_143 [Pseudomonadota bacterium]
MPPVDRKLNIGIRSIKLSLCLQCMQIEFLNDNIDTSSLKSLEPMQDANEPIMLPNIASIVSSILNSNMVYYNEILFEN